MQFWNTFIFLHFADSSFQNIKLFSSNHVPITFFNAHAETHKHMFTSIVFIFRKICQHDTTILQYVIKYF